ncbi:MAG: hypothetical protein KAS72_12995 [Phycisphaerales bacterium]|nr:hypothetical protein [Phycisphaerales bacterium]
MVVLTSTHGDRRKRPPALSKRQLSSSRARLLEMMQELNFGRIENLRIRAGDPVFNPPPRRVYEIKFGGDNGPRPEAEIGDFALKRQVQDLLVQLDRIGDGLIEVLVVKHGLPFSMQVAEDSEVDAA